MELGETVKHALVYWVMERTLMMMSMMTMMMKLIIHLRYIEMTGMEGRIVQTFLVD